MAKYQEVRVKLTNTQLNKLKSTAQNKTGTILRLNKKNFRRWRITTRLISKDKTNNWNNKFYRQHLPYLTKT